MREKRFSWLDLIAISVISNITMVLLDHINFSWVW